MRYHQKSWDLFCLSVLSTRQRTKSIAMKIMKRLTWLPWPHNQQTEGERTTFQQQRITNCWDTRLNSFKSPYYLEGLKNGRQNGKPA
jgi:hypothetical protein